MINDINHLENTEIANFQLLSDKKAALESIREERIQGQMIRSRIQWLSEGEKPSKFFCNLESKNSLEKTIKKVKNDQGHYLTEQAEILKYIKNYYQHLFENKDETDHELGHPICASELSEVLKKMKHNKTPGMDGLTFEFLKVFWVKLKFLITKAINRCFEKGKLSTTLRQGIITCVPKGKQERCYMKNWRPISLLCVTYKLASGALGNRLKSVLDKIISKTQRGFIAGRQMSDCTSLIYDIMQTAENKAFNTLEFFGFSEKFINWIKLLNNDIKMYVLQSGYLSEEICVGRGCRQGDPLSPYLFLFGAEFMALLFLMNPEIIGFKINSKEFKLTQFADDTTLILDGSQHSLQAALNTLEIYGNFSGLKMNKEKTKVIWIGRKKYSKDKLTVSVNLDWGKVEFVLLGITFNVNLNLMPDINLVNVLENANTSLKV